MEIWRKKVNEAFQLRFLKLNLALSVMLPLLSLLKQVPPCLQVSLEFLRYSGFFM